MVVSEQNVVPVQRELRSAIDRKLSGRYAQLARACEFFIANSEHAVMQLSEIGDAFSKALHDILNIRTIFLRFETMLSVPDMEQNQLHRFLEADIDLFFSYVQSILDYLTEGASCVFSYNELGNHPSFSRLCEKYKADKNTKNSNAKKKTKPFVPKDSIEGQLSKLITTSDAEWIGQVRGIRNELIHRGAEPRVMIDSRSQEVVFQIFQNSKPLIGGGLHRCLFYRENPTYLNFKACAGIILGRLIAFANSVADVCYEKLGSKMAETVRASITEIALPNVAIALDWIEAGSKCVSEQAIPAAINRSILEFQPDDLVSRENLVAYIDGLILDLTERPLQHDEVLERIISVNALIKIVTNSKKVLVSPPWLEEQSIQSFRAECIMRKHKVLPGQCLTNLLSLLDDVRNQIVKSNQSYVGKIDHNWRMWMLDAQTSSTSALATGLKLFPQPTRITI